MTDPTPADTHPGMPRWLKISLAVLAVLILVAIVLAVAGVGGQHGPGPQGH